MLIVFKKKYKEVPILLNCYFLISKILKNFVGGCLQLELKLLTPIQTPDLFNPCWTYFGAKNLTKRNIFTKNEVRFSYFKHFNIQLVKRPLGLNILLSSVQRIKKNVMFEMLQLKTRFMPENCAFRGWKNQKITFIPRFCFQQDFLLYLEN